MLNKLANSTITANLDSPHGYVSILLCHVQSVI